MEKAKERESIMPRTWILLALDLTLSIKSVSGYNGTLNYVEGQQEPFLCDQTCKDLVTVEPPQKVGVVCAQVVGGYLEVNLTLIEDFGCSLTETHICNIPTTTYEPEIEKPSHMYVLDIDEVYDYMCFPEVDEDTFTVAGHATVHCDRDVGDQGQHGNTGDESVSNVYTSYYELDICCPPEPPAKEDEDQKKSPRCHDEGAEHPEAISCGNRRRQDCPYGYYCSADPEFEYFVCCEVSVDTSACVSGDVLNGVTCDADPNAQSCPSPYFCAPSPGGGICCNSRIPPGMALPSNETRCSNGLAEHSDAVNCTFGPDRKSCPEGYQCEEHAEDNSSICCKVDAETPLPIGTTEPFDSRCVAGANEHPEDIFCGEGPGRQDCPQGYYCFVNPWATYAVCCEDNLDSVTCPSGLSNIGTCDPNNLDEDCPDGASFCFPILAGGNLGVCCEGELPPVTTISSPITSTNLYTTEPFDNNCAFSGSEEHPDDIFCGEGLGYQDCPEGYYCFIHPRGRFAVCCEDNLDTITCRRGHPNLGVCDPGNDLEDCPNGSTYCFPILSGGNVGVCCNDDELPFVTSSIPATTQRSTEPAIVPQTSFASYLFRFVNLWTAENHPNDFPSDQAHWSSQVVSMHNDEYRMWSVGSLASPSVKIVAETGESSAIRGELNEAMSKGYVSDFNVGELQWNNNSQSQDILFTARNSHPFVSAISTMTPSPDWFAGVNDVKLTNDSGNFLNITIDSPPYDAGTDSGKTYYSDDNATDPPVPIFELDNSTVPQDTQVFVKNGRVLPVARFEFILLED